MSALHLCISHDRQRTQECLRAHESLNNIFAFKFEDLLKFNFFLIHFQVLGIICMSLASPAYIVSTHWFLFVVVTAFIATILWICVYFLGVREVLNLSINWILTVIYFIDRIYNFTFRNLRIFRNAGYFNLCGVRTSCTSCMTTQR